MTDEYTNPIEEAFAQRQEQHDRYHLFLVDTSNAFGRMLSEELTVDQLATLKTIFQLISEGGKENHFKAVAYYEGMVTAALTVRKIRCDEVPTAEEAQVPT